MFGEDCMVIVPVVPDDGARSDAGSDIEVDGNVEVEDDCCILVTAEKLP